MDYYKGNLASSDFAGVDHKMPFSFPYRQHAYSPFWQAPNSQANFCEEDYIITPYIAEFMNTLTNLIYLFYAYHGIKNNANRKDAILRNLPYLGIACVGIGSGVFHSTLKNYTQWGDDLSMLVATATVIHRVFTYDKSLNYTVIHGLTLFSAMTAFSIWHCVTDELFMHSVVFGVMIVIVRQKTRSVIKVRVTDPAVLKDVRLLAVFGAIFFASGFAIWNVDIMMCNTLTAWKRTIGLPWSFVLELHGWWHILTGLGAYIFIALVEYLTSEEAGQPLGSRFAWPVGYLISSSGKSSSSKINHKHAGINTNKAFEKVKGSSSVKHASGSNNVAGLFGVKDLKTA
ncbi:hypothetical protein GLAREA_04373 [Glarea lozoyensis ATCC 20868]|uniref:Alkaline ceramidase 3 n=1 Tax=Glarea lozoyensis (strain ATCC 20868 / MF5171) TaxID=1116229 RepID=S3CM40_GLAL2|nr:uncharacterized protein GLAREA_04373 [Glarea lozoyensis ATCC 20868]EPE27582.1 hypothetical protein GLAREA_04373 [Glarea lozoyensis ATCC 20868]